MNDDYTEDLEKRIEVLEERLENYDFFVVTDISVEIETEEVESYTGVFFGDASFVISGVGAEYIDISIGRLYLWKMLRLPIDRFFWELSGTIGLDIKFFHGSMVGLAKKYIICRKVVEASVNDVTKNTDIFFDASFSDGTITIHGR